MRYLCFFLKQAIWLHFHILMPNVILVNAVRSYAHVCFYTSEDLYLYSRYYEQTNIHTYTTMRTSVLVHNVVTYILIIMCILIYVCTYYYTYMYTNTRMYIVIHVCTYWYTYLYLCRSVWNHRNASRTLSPGSRIPFPRELLAIESSGP